MELNEARLEKFDVEGVLEFAGSVLTNLSRFWLQASVDQKIRFQKILFPNGLTFDGKKLGTATTCLAFSYLREISSANSNLASQSILSWNQITSWLKEMETLRAIAA